MLKLVKFECDCVGTVPATYGDKVGLYSHMFFVCDAGNEADGPWLIPRRVDKKSFTHLTVKETAPHYYHRIQRALIEGDKFVQLRLMLKDDPDNSERAGEGHG